MNHRDCPHWSRLWAVEELRAELSNDHVKGLAHRAYGLGVPMRMVSDAEYAEYPPTKDALIELLIRAILTEPSFWVKSFPSHATSTNNVLTAEELSERDVTVEDASVVDTLAKVSCLVFVADDGGPKPNPPPEIVRTLGYEEWNDEGIYTPYEDIISQADPADVAFYKKNKDDDRVMRGGFSEKNPAALAVYVEEWKDPEMGQASIVRQALTHPAGYSIVYAFSVDNAKTASEWLTQLGLGDQTPTIVSAADVESRSEEALSSLLSERFLVVYGTKQEYSASGRWTGFWHNQDSGQRGDMALDLVVEHYTTPKERSGRQLRGTGVDDVGPFTITGEVRDFSRTGIPEISISKQYTGAHLCEYRGNSTDAGKYDGRCYQDGQPGWRFL